MDCRVTSAFTRVFDAMPGNDGCLPSIERLHHRAQARVRADRAGADRRDCIAVDGRRPQAIESDVVAVLAMHAGDAGVLVPARAMLRGDLVREGLSLAGPRNDPAGVVAAIDL